MGDKFLEENRDLVVHKSSRYWPPMKLPSCLIENSQSFSSTPWLHLNTYIIDGDFELQVAIAAFNKLYSKYLR